MDRWIERERDRGAINRMIDRYTVRGRYIYYRYGIYRYKLYLTSDIIITVNISSMSYVPTV
jgi:hypothetical protein